MTQTMKYIFGPVPSRRLGKSLGIDVIPPKTCTFDCIYCQVGRTTSKSVTREDFVPIEPIINELKEVLKSKKPDYITISGSGEPTLFSNLGTLIDEIRKTTDIKIAVITNGSLLYKSEVRKDLLKTDLVLPTLAADSKNTYDKIHRHHDDISFEKHVEGLIKFREEYSGQIWLEIFFMKNVNDSPQQVDMISNIASQVNADKIQLNTCSRPSADKCEIVKETFLEEISSKFKPKAEVIADYPESAGHNKADEQEILDYLARRPATIEDLSSALDIASLELLKVLPHMVENKLIESYHWNQKVYYKVASKK